MLKNMIEEPELSKENLKNGGDKKQISGSKFARLFWFFLMVLSCLFAMLMIYLERGNLVMTFGLLFTFELAVFLIVFFDRKESRSVSLKFLELEYTHEYAKTNKIDHQKDTETKSPGSKEEEYNNEGLARQLPPEIREN